jgi:rare lipoprotein A
MADTKHTTHLVVVSWYGKHWSGRHTSNGERFNPRMLTAASKTLPMGTRVLVKNGSKTVIVRINDRGPYVRGRSLDLSEAAAVRLGIRKQGVAKVSMKIVNAP